MANIIYITVPTKGYLEFDFTNSLITAEDTINVLTAQELANAARNAEDELMALNYPQIVSMAGKTEINPAGLFTGIVIELLGWFIVSDKTSGSFTVQDGTVIKTGAAGNIFAANNLVTQQNILEVGGTITVVEVSGIGQELTYGGNVYLDLIGGTSGTTYPKGTLADPVDNLADALTIATSYNITHIQLNGDLTLNTNVSGYHFENWKNGTINLNNQLTIGSGFTSLEVSGTQNGFGRFFTCRIANLQNLEGIYEACIFVDSTAILLKAAQVTMHDCYSAIPGGHFVTLDCNNNGLELEMRNASMGLKLINYKHASNLCDIGIDAGLIWIDSTCIAGTIYCGGIFGLLDESGSGCTIDLSSRAGDYETLEKTSKSASNAFAISSAVLSKV